jgi:uncharacterized protein (TIGR02145 family)
VHNDYLTGNDEAAAACCYWFSECTYGEANTYTLPIADAGTFTVWAKAVTAHGCVDSVATTVTHVLPPAISLASGNDSQTIDIGDAITQIQYTTANATSATTTGLPPGVTGVWATNTYTISGTPTDSGTYNYTVTTTNDKGCANASASGTITVIYNPFVSGTWSCGAQTWSGALRNPTAGCSLQSSLTTASTPQYYDRGPSYGYYYNWTCVKEKSTILCPSPWRTPTKDNLITLRSCAGGDSKGSVLKAAFGVTGFIDGSAVYNANTGYVVSHDVDGQLAVALYYVDAVMRIGEYEKRYGFQVRCVQ